MGGGATENSQVAWDDWPEVLRPLLAQYGLEEVTRVSINTLGYHPCMIRNAGEAKVLRKELRHG